MWQGQVVEGGDIDIGGEDISSPLLLTTMPERGKHLTCNGSGQVHGSAQPTQPKQMETAPRCDPVTQKYMNSCCYQTAPPFEGCWDKSKNI